MKRISEIRLENMHKLIEEVGTVSELARLAGYKQPSYLYQIINQTAIQNGKPKNIGDKMARKLEEATGKSRGWMDTIHQTINAQNVQLSNNYGGGSQNNTQYNMYQQGAKSVTDDTLPEQQAGKVMPLLDISDGLHYTLGGYPQDEIQKAKDKIAAFIGHSDKSFGIKMADDSMTIQSATDSETIFKGDILVIEPLMEPRDNDIVFICLDYPAKPRPIIARLQVGIDGRRYINQPNRGGGFVPMPDGALICGVVIEIKRRIIEPDIFKSRYDDNWDIKKTLEP